LNTFLAFLIAYPSVAVTALLVPALALRWFLAASNSLDRTRAEWLIVLAALIQPAASVALLAARALSPLRPGKLDLYIFQLDRLFGEPSFALGRLAVAHPWLGVVSSISYGLLSVSIFATVAAYILWRPAAEARMVAVTFSVCLFLATPLYLLIPVCGPAYAFTSFPALPPAGLQLHLIALSAAPNGVPSVHMAIALLVWFFFGLGDWGWGWTAVGGLFAALTAFATLSSGEHYLFDLICAPPYVLCVLTLSIKVAARIERALE
jgi:hypothetical protein